MNRSERIALRVLVALYVLVFSIYTLERHNRFNSSALDLGIQDNVLWNTLHGRPFRSSIETENYLGDHVTLTIPLFSLFYLIRDDVRIILILQTLLLAAGAFPLARLAAKKLKTAWAGPAAALAYLFYPPLGFINRFDFHPEVAVVPLLLFAVWCFEEKRNGWGYLLTLLALGSKEQIGLVIGVWGLSLLLFERNWRRGLLFTILGFGWSYFALFHVIPFFRGEGSDTLSRYNYLAESPGGLLAVLVHEPGRVLGQLFNTPERRLYVWRLLWPVAGLCLLCPKRFLIVLPVVGYNLLSREINQHSIYYQYNAPLIPWVFVGAIEGLEQFEKGRTRLFRWIRSKERWALSRIGLGAIVLCSLAAFALHNPLGTKIGRPHYEVYGWERIGNAREIRQAAGMIPPAADLATTMGLAPHFTHRQEIRLWWGGAHLDSDYILVNLFDHRWGTSFAQYIEWLGQAIETHGHRVIYFNNGVVLTESREKNLPDRTEEVSGFLTDQSHRKRPRHIIGFEIDPVSGHRMILYRSGSALDIDTKKPERLFSQGGDLIAFTYLPAGRGAIGLGEQGRLLVPDSSNIQEGSRRPLSIFTDVESTPDGRGCYVLDRFGRISTYGTAKSFGDDWRRSDAGAAVDLALTPDGQGYAILWSHGQVAMFGQCKLEPPFQPFGWNIARALLLTGADRGYLLDGYGAIHSLGSAPKIVCSGYDLVDRMIDLEIDAEGRAWVLDQKGRFHPAAPSAEE